MTHFFAPLLRFVFHLGYAGPFVMGIMDSSFLFLPFGNDLLVVALVARHHQGLPFYVLTAAAGSVLGVLLIDLVARKSGEAGIEKMAGHSRFEQLKRKIGQRGGTALVVGALAPPPFPFTMVVACTSALGYPRFRLLLTVGLARAARFVILGFLAMRFGRTILHIFNTSGFRWTMIAFIALCIVGSVFSIAKWVKSTRGKKSAPLPQTA